MHDLVASSLSTMIGGPSGGPNLLPPGVALLSGGLLLILALWVFVMTFMRGAQHKWWKRLAALILAAVGAGLVFFSQFIIDHWTPVA